MEDTHADFFLSISSADDCLDKFLGGRFLVAAAVDGPSFSQFFEAGAMVGLDVKDSIFLVSFLKIELTEFFVLMLPTFSLLVTAA